MSGPSPLTIIAVPVIAVFFLLVLLPWMRREDEKQNERRQEVIQGFN